MTLLVAADRVMNNSFWMGVYPGMERAMLEEMAKRLLEVGQAANGGTAP